MLPQYLLLVPFLFWRVKLWSPTHKY
jgi:hypothetical protein